MYKKVPMSNKQTICLSRVSANSLRKPRFPRLFYKTERHPLPTHFKQKHSQNTPLTILFRKLASLFPPYSSSASEESLKKWEISLQNCLSEIEKAPKDISLQAKYVQELLYTAYACKLANHPKLEKANKENARRVMEKVKKMAYFHPGSQCASYLFRVYHGMTCLDIQMIQDCLLTLRKAIALDPSNPKLSHELDQVTSFLNISWNKLYEDGELDQMSYSLFKKRLQITLSKDPFKETFIKRPALFKLVGKAPKEFLERHPHFTSPNDFLAAYPEVGDCKLKDRIYNINNLKLCLEQAKTDPLCRRIFLTSEKPILNPSAIGMIKNTLIDHPYLQVLLGNEKDGENLAKSFSDDPMLVPNKGCLKCEINKKDESPSTVYSYFIDPANLFIRKVVVKLLNESKQYSKLSSATGLNVNPLLTPVQIRTDFPPQPIIISGPTKPVITKTESPKTFTPPSLLPTPVNSPESVFKEKLSEIQAIISQKQSLIPSSHTSAERSCYHGECAHYLLAEALIHRTCKNFEEEKRALHRATTHVRSALSDYLISSAQYASYLLKAYPSINCLDINTIQDCLLTLRKSCKSKELEETVTFFKKSWIELKNAGSMDEEAYQLFNKRLAETLKQDPYKEDFIKDPILFQHIARECLLYDYPHLSTPETFLAKYPEAGYVFLAGAYSYQRLEDAIKRANDSPLATHLFLVSATPLLDQKSAESLQRFLMKKLSVDLLKFALVIGNKEDENLLRKTFRYDPYIVCRPLAVKDHPEAILFYVDVDL